MLGAGNRAEDRAGVTVSAPAVALPSPAPSPVPSPLLSRPGAVAGEGVDAPVAAHYGDPLREQRLLVEGLAAVDLSHRGVLTIAGPDRLTWLHSITTQMLTGLAPRTSAETLVLSPKGHIEHDLHLVDDGETTWVTVEPGTAVALKTWLKFATALCQLRFGMRCKCLLIALFILSYHLTSYQNNNNRQ